MENCPVHRLRWLAIAKKYSTKLHLLDREDALEVLAAVICKPNCQDFTMYLSHCMSLLTVQYVRSLRDQGKKPRQHHGHSQFVDHKFQTSAEHTTPPSKFVPF